MSKPTPLLILVAGPYRSGTNDQPELIAGNVDRAIAGASAEQGLRPDVLPIPYQWARTPLA